MYIFKRPWMHIPAVLESLHFPGKLKQEIDWVSGNTWGNSLWTINHLRNTMLIEVQVHFIYSTARWTEIWSLFDH